MFPIALNLASVPIFLIGEGEALTKRRRQLEEAGAQLVSEMRDAAVVMIAGLTFDESKHIADDARRQKKLVNVEDVNELCDFYFTAHVRRGDLTIAVSTNGVSPTLAARVRDSIAHQFGPEWAERAQALKHLRHRLRGEKKSMGEVKRESEKFLAEKGWFSA